MTQLEQQINTLEQRIKLLAKANTTLVVLLLITSFIENNYFPSILAPALVISYSLRVAYKRKLKYKRAVSEEVEKHTVEIKTERDAAEAKSKKLKYELTVLEETKDEQVRQEKIETVGELAKGLVDRMLNPLNYINNFGLLSKKIADDLDLNLNEWKSEPAEEVWNDSKELVATLRNNLDKIVEHGYNATMIVKAMEELLRDRRGKVEIIPINEFVNRVVESYEQKIRAKATTPPSLVVLPLSQETVIEINQLQLEQSLRCLLDNACYSIRKKSSRTVDDNYRPTIEVGLTTDDEQLLITITDNGMGIEEAIREKIFAPFFTTKPTHEGAGVGLYMAREVIENHKGTISVDSHPGQFARFTITLPLRFKTVLSTPNAPDDLLLGSIGPDNASR